MRPIKFRIWTRMGEPLVLEPDWLGDYHWGIGKGMDLGEDPPKEMEQFTGLTDKMGKDIYEGDIIYMTYSYGHERDSSGDIQGHYLVEYIDGEFVMSGKNLWGDDEDERSLRLYASERQKKDKKLDEFEVVGNIHENPNLLS